MKRRRSVFGHLHRRKRRDGSFKPGWYLRLRRGAGPSVVRWAGPDLRTATQFQADLERQAARGDLLQERPVVDVTFADLKPVLLEALQATHASTTLAADRGRVDRIVAHFGTRLLREIRTSDLQEFLNGLRTARFSRREGPSVEGPPASPATRNRYASALSVAFDLAVQKGFMRSNPAQGIKRQREALRPVPFLTDGDTERIIEGTPNPRFRALLRVLVDTGLRRSEAARLEWRDVDLGRGVLVVRESKTRRPREVPMSGLVKAALLTLSDGVAMGALGLQRPIWPEFAGHLSAIEGRFRRLTRRLGIKLNLHALRHGFCSGRAQEGTPLPTISALAGHQSVATTMRYASHLPTGATHDAIRKMDVARAKRAADAPQGHPGGHPSTKPDPEGPDPVG